MIKQNTSNRNMDMHISHPKKKKKKLNGVLTTKHLEPPHSLLTSSSLSYTMALAALAILGHKSAHSFPMGPVIADPRAKNLSISDKR